MVWWDQTVALILFLIETSILISIVTGLIYNPSSSKHGFLYSKIVANTCLFSQWQPWYPDLMRWNCNVILICISYVFIDHLHFFTWNLSVNVCCPFINCIVSLLLHNFWNSLYILAINFLLFGKAFLSLCILFPLRWWFLSRVDAC